MSSGVKIFSGRASVELAEKIANGYGAQLGDVKVTDFSDGEFQPSFEETVRGQDVFIIQSTMPPTENLFELLLMVDAAKRASANKIIVVISLKNPFSWGLCIGKSSKSYKFIEVGGI